MSVPSTGEAFSKFIEHLKLAQEDAATLYHLHTDTDRKSKLMGQGWFVISEALKLMIHNATSLATKGRLN